MIERPDDDETVIVGPADDDATVIVDRAGESGETTLVHDRTAPLDDETVLVERSAEPDPEATLLDEPTEEPDPDDTVSLSGAEPDDSTLVVRDTGATPDRDETVIIDDDATVPAGDPDTTVPTPRGAVPAPESTAPPAAMAPPSRHRRGELRPAPVPSGFGGRPLVAAGAGAVSSYRARGVLAPPVPRRPDVTNAAPAREFGAVASVARRSRLASRATIAACVVAALLLAGALVWAVEELVGR